MTPYVNTMVQELVKKYSEFINFPINLWATKKVDEEVPADQDVSSANDKTSDKSSEDGEEEEDTEKDDKEEEKPKTKTIKKTTHECELLNDVKAIWLRNPNEITEE